MKYFVDSLKARRGKPFDITNDVHASVFDVLCLILIGKRFCYNDEFYMTLLHNMDYTAQKAMAVSSALSCFPFLR